MNYLIILEVLFLLLELSCTLIRNEFKNEKEIVLISYPVSIYEYFCN